jgi:hypothetical protein
MRRLLLIPFLLVCLGLSADAGPTIRKVSAAQCPAATLVVIEQATVGVVVERADALPDSLDQTPTVRVLVLKPQTEPPSAYKVGDVAQLGGVEIVISRGPLVLPD